MINWLDIFEYIEGKLYWKIKPARRVEIGDLAGNPTSEGYLQIVYRGNRTTVHRIVWFMHNGNIPKDMELDHINHIRDDNRIENLRLVTKAVNAKNRRMNAKNTSGVSGVSWQTAKKKWISQIQVNGKNIYLGRFKNFDDAVKARKAAELTHGFHANHGK